MKHITKLANGKDVYYDPTGPAATHIADTPQLLGLVREFLKSQQFHEPVVWLEHDMGRIIGTTDLVETNNSDEVVYAKRLHRDSYTRFAKKLPPIPTTYLTVALRLDDRGAYELASAWIGRICPNTPDEPGATPDSAIFWATHALAWGTQAVRAGTETTVCPW